MKTLSLLTLSLLLTGCTHTEFKFGQASLKTTRFGTQTKLGKINFKQGTNEFSLEGYTSDQVEGLKAVAEGVAKGLAQGVK